MKCREVRFLLPEYLREELDGESRAAVMDHLKGCRNCASEARELDALLHDLKIPETRPDERYFTTLLPRIHERIDERSARKVPSWFPSVAVPLAAAAVIVLAILTAIPSSRQTSAVDDLRGILSQIKTDPQEAVNEVQTTSAILAPQSYLSAQADTAESDKDIVKDLFNGDVRTGYAIEFDPRQYVDHLDKQSTNQLLALLDERIPNH